MSVVKEFESKVSRRDIIQWVDFPRSSYYYKPTHGRKGIAPSTHTRKRDGTEVSNDTVVEEIKTVLSGEYVLYGYQNVTAELRDLEYIINPKKVYRLMDENHLLLGKVIRTQGKREWVKYRKISASKPMEYLCWDIKYVWVQGERKNYYLLSLMDVYTRRILDWIFQGSIRKVDVLKMINRVNLRHDLKGVTVRNDNGSQFIANTVRHYLRTLDAHQEFTHIATPQENSYIEAFHSIFEREVIQRFEFASFYEAKQIIAAYMDFYNNRRRHGSLGRRAPIQKWKEYNQSLSTDEPSIAQGSEEMSRVSACVDTSLALDMSGDPANFVHRSMNETEFFNKKLLNSFD